MSSIASLLGNEYVRSVLLFVLLAVNIALIGYLVKMRHEQQRKSATLSALLAESERKQNLDEGQQKLIEQGVRLLAEIAGHIEVGFNGRTHFSPASREFLDSIHAAGTSEYSGKDPA